MSGPDFQALLELNPTIGLALYTDGSSDSKDRSGGWAWLALDHHGGEASASGYASDTTNNRMEMMAWIDGLETLAEWVASTLVVVFSDSQIVGLGATDRGRNRKANLDLWKRLDAAVAMHEHVEFVHVKAHLRPGAPKYNVFNDTVDRAAGAARLEGKANEKGQG